MTRDDIDRGLRMLVRLLEKAEALAWAVEDASMSVPGGWRDSDQLQAVTGVVEEARRTVARTALTRRNR